MPYLENKESEKNDDIVKCDDGTYRWIYELPMLKSLFLLFEVWRVMFLAGIIMGLFMCMMSLIEGEAFLEALKNAGISVGIVLGIIIVLSLPAYLIVTHANNGRYTVLFEMDENFLSHTQIKTEKAQALDLLTILVGGAANNATTTGIGMMNASGGSLTSKLAKVRHIILRRKKHYIRLNGLLKRNMVYVKDSDFDFVKDFLIGHCPQAKVSGR